jgi:hypothetical protein
LSAFEGDASIFTVTTGAAATATSSLTIGGVPLTSYNFGAGSCEATYPLASSAFVTPFTIAQMLAGVIVDTVVPSLGTLVIREPKLNGNPIVDSSVNYTGAFITPSATPALLTTSGTNAGEIAIEFTTAANPKGICSLWFNIPVRAFSAATDIGTPSNLWYIRPGIDIVNVDSGPATTGAGILVSNGVPENGGPLLIIVQ